MTISQAVYEAQIARIADLEAKLVETESHLESLQNRYSQACAESDELQSRLDTLQSQRELDASMEKMNLEQTAAKLIAERDEALRRLDAGIRLLRNHLNQSKPMFETDIEGALASLTESHGESPDRDGEALNSIVRSRCYNCGHNLPASATNCPRCAVSILAGEGREPCDPPCILERGHDGPHKGRVVERQ